MDDDVSISQMSRSNVVVVVVCSSVGVVIDLREENICRRKMGLTRRQKYEHLRSANSFVDNLKSTVKINKFSKWLRILDFCRVAIWDNLAYVRLG